MKRKMKKNLLCRIVIIVIAASLAFSTLTASANVSNGISDRINQILQEYPEGSFFSVNGNACIHGEIKACANCQLLKVRPELIGKVNTDAWTCCGFARYVFYKIFGLNTYNYLLNCTEASLENARMGDFVVMNNGSHYAIYLYSNGDIHYFYESNYGVANKVRYCGAYTTDKLSTARFWHANNYDDVAGIGSNVNTISDSVPVNVNTIPDSVPINTNTMTNPVSVNTNKILDSVPAKTNNTDPGDNINIPIPSEDDSAELVPIHAIPTNLTAHSSGNNSLKLTWSVVPGAYGYKVYRAISNYGTYINIANTTSTSYIDTELTTNKTYYYKVRSYVKVGSTEVYSEYSAVVNAKPVLSVAGDLSVVRVNTTSVKLIWSAVGDVSGYQIYRATSKMGVYSLIKSTTALSFTNTRLIKGKTYYYKIRAYKVEGTAKVYSNWTQVKNIKL